MHSPQTHSSGGNGTGGTTSGREAGFATEAELHAAVARRARWFQCFFVACLLTIALGLLLSLTISRMIATDALARNPLRNAVLATMSDIAVPLATVHSGGDALKQTVWQDVSDLSWDVRSQAVVATLRLEIHYAPTLLNLPIGPGELLLTVNIASPAELSTADAERLRDKLLADILARLQDASAEGTRFPDAIEYDFRSGAQWSRFLTPSFRTASLKTLGNPANTTWVARRSTFDPRFLALWCVIVFGPIAIIFGLLGARSTRRTLRHLRTGCERCGFPLLPCQSNDTWSFARCSECGHDTTPALLNPTPLTRRIAQTKSNHAPQPSTPPS